MPTPVLQVRPVEPDEHEAVAALTVAVYRGEGHSSAGYEPALRDVAGRVASATVLVALDAGRVVGAVTVATRQGPWAEQAAPGEAVIRMLVVDPAARGRGAGQALSQAAVDTARADGCTLVRLSSQPEMAAAHRLYGRMGFVRTPSFDWSPEQGVQLLGFALPLVEQCPRCGERLTGEGHQACRDAAAAEQRAASSS